MGRLKTALKLSGKLFEHKEEGYWLRGSGLVYVPKDRINEIPTVIKEHRQREADLGRIRTMIARVI